MELTERLGQGLVLGCNRRTLAGSSVKAGDW